MRRSFEKANEKDVCRKVFLEITKLLYINFKWMTMNRKGERSIYSPPKKTNAHAQIVYRLLTISEKNH